MGELFRHILVPHDFSTAAARALELAAAVAVKGGRLLVLHVIEPLPSAPDVPAWTPSAADVRTATSRLGAVTKRIVNRPGIAIDCRVVVGDPYREIMRAARGVDSIVMATTGRTGLARLVIGSVAEKVIRHAPLPVLTIRARRGTVGRGRA